jgi:predicted phage tail protein
VEQLRFSDQTVNIGLPAAPVIGTATAGNGQATVNWTPGAATLPGITSFTLTIRNAAGTALASPAPITGIAPGATSRVVSGLTNGTSYRFTVKAVSAAGTGPDSALSNVVTPTAPPAAPGPVTLLTAARNGSGSVGLAWTPPAGLKTGYEVQVRNGVTNAFIRTITGIPGTATGTTVTGLTGGTSYRFQVRAINATGPGPFVAVGPITATSAPGAPGIGLVVPGLLGGALTLTVNWTAPASNGGSAITLYRVRTQRFTTNSAASAPIGGPTFVTVGPAARALTQTLPAGNYRFSVVAINAVGTSAASALSANGVPR